MALLLLCLLGLPTYARAALNLGQGVEEAVVHLRDRVFIADSLVSPSPAGTCDSRFDGPHCGHLGVGANKGIAAPRSLLLADGALSSRLFGSTEGGEVLDHWLESVGKLEAAVEALRADRPREKAKSETPPTSPRRLARPVLGSRSALLTFTGLEPWRVTFPIDHAGGDALGSFPFAVRWRGPWALVSNPIHGSGILRPGRFVAELQGAIGSIHFGRPVHLQAIDLALPERRRCPGSRPDSRWSASPLVLRGKRGDAEVFTEVIPQWDLGRYVNGVAFFSRTAVDWVDSISFLAAECVLVAVMQASFGTVESPAAIAAGADGGAEHAGGSAPTSSSLLPPSPLPSLNGGSMLITFNAGWQAFSFEEVNFVAIPRVGDAAVWNVNEAAEARLVLRPGAFEDPPLLAREQLPEEVVMAGSGPEQVRMPAGLEELEGTIDLHDPLDDVMRDQRNASVLRDLMKALEEETPRGVAADGRGGDAASLFGLPREDVNADLARLLERLVVVSEGGTGDILGADSSSEIFDGAWRNLGLDALDSLLVRWRVAQNGAPAPPKSAEPEDSGSAALASVPGAALTSKLASTIILADRAIELRVLAKNKKVRDMMQIASKDKSGVGGSPKYRTRVESESDGRGVRVVMDTDTGLQYVGVLRLDAGDVEALVQSLNPSSGRDSRADGDDSGDGSRP